jgi:hypothetical protein
MSVAPSTRSDWDLCSSSAVLGAPAVVPPFPFLRLTAKKQRSEGWLGRNFLSTLNTQHSIVPIAPWTSRKSDNLNLASPEIACGVEHDSRTDAEYAGLEDDCRNDEEICRWSAPDTARHGQQEAEWIAGEWILLFLVGLFAIRSLLRHRTFKFSGKFESGVFVKQCKIRY